MTEYLTERSLEIPVAPGSPDFQDLEAKVAVHLAEGESPVRFAVSRSEPARYQCDIGVLTGARSLDSIFRFSKRQFANESEFNVVMIVPTGIGAEAGGHAGDAAPTAALLASVCDQLITHPNVLNASDIIQIPHNALYVEGSVITGLLMGTIGLGRSRGNRLLVLIQNHQDELFTNAAINAVNAAHSSYGLRVARIVGIDDAFKMSAEYTPSGVAAGSVRGLDRLWATLDTHRDEFDAIAITSVIDVPPHFHRDYYLEAGEMVNPWGGVEAILTHAISLQYKVPAAHSPMFESREIAEIDLGVVDPRMAAEVISVTFLQSILRGLQYSPHLVDRSDPAGQAALTVEDVACLVIPEGCLGLPTLAALAQGINVIAVRENRNIMRNELGALPWRDGQFYTVDNYWEAAGVLAALRAGLDPVSVRRPLRSPPSLLPFASEADVLIGELKATTRSLPR